MEDIQHIMLRAQRAKKSVAVLSDEDKAAVLRRLAEVIVANTQQIITENRKDLARMETIDPKYDRLLLNAERIAGLAQGLEEVAALPDPTHALLSSRTMPNGLFIEKRTVPLGVVGVIYESRPNVTVDVASLCLRSGNVCLLRGGQDAQDTNAFVVGLIQEVLQQSGLDRNIVQQLPPDRKYILDILTAVKYIDVIIPRGSEQLITFVRQNALVPVIETGAGVCHTYIERTAKLDNAAMVVTNAKVSRPSVCNSLDTVLVDRLVAKPFLERLAPLLHPYNVEIFADEEGYTILEDLKYPLLQRAKPEDYGREFLDFKCSVKVVNGLDEALDHIAEFSSKHSEAILTEDSEKAEIFLNQVDAAAVYQNASTRFTDGQVFGLGAEIGISTQKLHARGPFALEKLVTEKWVIRGEGQIR